MKASGVGRPSVDPAYRIRTRAWFRAVIEASGMDDSQLEVLFGGTNSANHYTAGARPGLWGKYKKGSMCPKFKRDIHNRPSIVERVEREFPGTANWMTMRFWDVLSNKRMDMLEIKEVYMSLPEEIYSLFLMDPLEPPYKSLFWRRPLPHEDILLLLADMGDLNAATGLLALVKEAEAIQSPELHLKSLMCWGILSSKLQQNSILAPLMPEITSLVEKKYLGFYYPLSNRGYGRPDSETMRKAWQLSPTEVNEQVKSVTVSRGP